ncbi:MAG: TIR domain-containing protein [Bryobacteraceae bacterium]
MTVNSLQKSCQPRVFVSYVREDQNTVDRLAKELSAYGIKVWLDKTELKPGYRWKDAIREAISKGDFFIACFSEAYQRRSKSYMNEELTLAIEELRQRPSDRAWFIPVLLSECEVPARGIGAGETLRDIQWVELYRDWEPGIIRIAAAIDPDAQIAKPPRVWQLEDREWLRLMYGFSEGRPSCVPILGPGINYGLVPDYEALARKWARELGNPELMDLTFSQVVEHLLQTRSRWEVVEALLNEHGRARLSELSAPGELHAILSRLPCKVFITVCTDGFLEDALNSQGKKPQSVIVGNRHFPGERWLSNEVFRPDVTEPLVVHVYGRLDVPESLVITVDDQMQLLKTSTEKLPIAARATINRSDCLWLGFSSGSIEQRTLFSLIDDVLHARRGRFLQFFDKEFESLARQKGRRQILLSEFMAELQSRLEVKNSSDSSS